MGLGDKMDVYFGILLATAVTVEAMYPNMNGNVPQPSYFQGAIPPSMEPMHGNMTVTQENTQQMHGNMGNMQQYMPQGHMGQMQYMPNMQSHMSMMQNNMPMMQGNMQPMQGQMMNGQMQQANMPMMQGNNMQQVQGNMMNGQMQQMQGNMQQVPGNIPMMQGNMQQVPNNMPMMQGNMQHMQGNMQHIQGNMQHIQGNMPVMQGNMQNMQGNMPMMPGNMQMMPGNMQQMQGNAAMMQGNMQGMGPVHGYPPPVHGNMQGNMHFMHGQGMGGMASMPGFNQHMQNNMGLTGNVGGQGNPMMTGRLRNDYPCDIKEKQCPGDQVCRMVMSVCFVPPCQPVIMCVDTPPASTASCQSGFPLISMDRRTEVKCTKGGNQCPGETKCVIDTQDNFAVCCWKMHKPGVCPRPVRMGSCIRRCEDDSSCPGDKKCCNNGCGTQCVDRMAKYTKPKPGPKAGKCPAPTHNMGPCTSVCNSDALCTGTMKCCPSMCGRSCMLPDSGTSKTSGVNSSPIQAVPGTPAHQQQFMARLFSIMRQTTDPGEMPLIPGLNIMGAGAGTGKGAGEAASGGSKPPAEGIPPLFPPNMNMPNPLEPQWNSGIQTPLQTGIQSHSPQWAQSGPNEIQRGMPQNIPGFPGMPSQPQQQPHLQQNLQGRMPQWMQQQFGVSQPMQPTMQPTMQLRLLPGSVPGPQRGFAAGFHQGGITMNQQGPSITNRGLPKPAPTDQPRGFPSNTASQPSGPTESKLSNQAAIQAAFENIVLRNSPKPTYSTPVVTGVGQIPPGQTNPSMVPPTASYDPNYQQGSSGTSSGDPQMSNAVLPPQPTNIPKAAGTTGPSQAPPVNPPQPTAQSPRVPHPAPTPYYNPLPKSGTNRFSPDPPPNQSMWRSPIGFNDQQPFQETPRPGFCPAVIGFGICLHTCARDSDCLSHPGFKCCSIGPCKTCMRPRHEAQPQSPK